MLSTGTLLLQSFKVLNNNINFSNRNSNYGPGWGHNCFQGKILIGTILLSAFFHIILLLIPMTVINIRPNLIFNTPQLKIYLEKSNKENKLVHSIEKGFTKPAKENDTDPSKKSEERVRGTVLGEPFRPIMQSPIKHRAFDRSSKIIRKKIVQRNVARQKALEYAHSAPPMHLIWAIVEKAQQVYPSGIDLTCSGAQTFVCRPQHRTIAKFLASQWAIMQMSSQKMPTIELARMSGFWRINNIFRSPSFNQ